MSTRTTRFTVLSIAASAAIIAILGATAAPPVTAGPVAQPPVVPTSTDPGTGTIMPKFTDSNPPALRGSASSDNYSVTIDSAPASAAPGQRVSITGHTTGFSAGNWVNAWIRLPDGTQVDDGGLIAADGTFTIPMTFEYPGTNTIQISAGTWPAEQWSATVPVAVGTATSASDQATGVVYHNLTGHPVVVTAANTKAGFRGATFSFCPSRGGSCEHQVATNTGNGWYVGVYTPSPSSFFYNMAPNTSDFLDVITYQNL